jgi:hypothetical protein
LFDIHDLPQSEDLLAISEREGIDAMSIARDVRIDLHLIYVLNVLISEKSVTRAAVRLNQIQPAVSVALRKLRQVTNDKILVRGNGGYVTTPRAQ